MIEDQEQITCLKNYSGEYYFQIEGDAGTYHLVTFPTTQEFILTFPDYLTVKGSLADLSSLYQELEAYEVGLTRWIYSAMKWYTDPEFREQETWHKHEITINETTFQLDYCQESDEFILTQPQRVIIANRQELTDTYPEINSLHSGRLSSLIIDIIYDATEGQSPPNRACPALPLPLCFSPKEYVIEGLHYSIDYNVDLDVFYIHSPVNIKKMPRCLMDTLLELNTIGDGELKKQMIAFMNNSRSSVPA